MGTTPQSYQARMTFQHPLPRDHSHMKFLPFQLLVRRVEHQQDGANLFKTEHEITLNFTNPVNLFSGFSV